MYILVKSYSKLSWHIIARIGNGNTYSLDIFYEVLQFNAFKFLIKVRNLGDMLLNILQPQQPSMYVFANCLSIFFDYNPQRS